MFVLNNSRIRNLIACVVNNGIALEISCFDEFGFETEATIF